MTSVAERLDNYWDSTELRADDEIIERRPKPYSDEEEKDKTSIKKPLEDSEPSVVSLLDIQKFKISSVHRSKNPKAMSFKTTAKWVGEVIEVSENSFSSRVFEDTSEDNGTEEYDDYVEFSFSEASSSDRRFIKNGAIFDWHIGRRFKPYGQVENTSIIVFRRMPVWRNYLESADEKAKEFASSMGWTDND